MFKAEALSRTWRKEEQKSPRLFFESDALTEFDEGVFLKVVVIPIGKVGTIMAAAAFLAGDRASRDELSERVKIL